MHTCRVPKFLRKNFCKDQVAQVGRHRDGDGSGTHAQEVHAAARATQYEQTHSAKTAFGEPRGITIGNERPFRKAIFGFPGLLCHLIVWQW